MIGGLGQHTKRGWHLACFLWFLRRSWLRSAVSKATATPTLPERLRGCSIFGEQEAHEAGLLLGKSKTADVVDAVVVTTAIRREAMVLTGDMNDISRLVRASGHEVAIFAV